ncbi:protein of unknown function [Trichlorobacter ammonificans]|uniref:Uncharacterized protein n=1 Tax=Trichlorobacter ammonificans TaxID=2916410 RepID=A0ABM9D6Q0_9BACT|nr:protein of unknown function [Trichlorobacter ammonificans]
MTPEEFAAKQNQNQKTEKLSYCWY